MSIERFSEAVWNTRLCAATARQMSVPSSTKSVSGFSQMQSLSHGAAMIVGMACQ